MSKTALITGITGQDGAYLAAFLLARGYRVHGGIRRTGVNGTGRLEELGIAREIELHDFELLEENNIRRVIGRVAPDEVYNLAAQSFVASSFDQPVYTANADALGVLRILDELRTAHASVRFYQASTSEMFGQARETPQSETTQFHPRSPYGVAKLFGHWATVNYRESYGLHASSGILFNHESPLRGREFVSRKITLAFARIAAGRQDVVELGNLSARRDWGFAGDYVEGMWMMLQQETPDDYVLASGQDHSVRDFAQKAAQVHGWEIEWDGEGGSENGRDRRTGRVLVRVNPRFYRPAEVDNLLGDAGKAHARLGWRPRTGFDRLVEMMAMADIGRVDSGVLAF